jgi:AcrR family transcriptional regulator
MAGTDNEDGEARRREEGRALLRSGELSVLLARLSEGGPEERRRARRLRTERAILKLAGEVGFEAITFTELLGRAGANRSWFYITYGDLEHCFAAAAVAAGKALCEELMRPCEEAKEWTAGMRDALGTLAGLVDSEPAVVRALVVEARSTGTAVTVTREEVLGRLSDAIDRARRESGRTRHVPPPITPRFILAGIEAVVTRFLDTRQSDGFAARTPDLLWLAVDFYRGPEAARAAVAEMRAGQG